MSEKASDRQVGGSHYKDMSIEPSEFCQKNRLGWCESNVIKYVCRHGVKNGKQDIEKAIHYLQLLLEWGYAPDLLSLCDTCGKKRPKCGIPADGHVSTCTMFDEAPV